LGRGLLKHSGGSVCERRESNVRIEAERQLPAGELDLRAEICFSEYKHRKDVYDLESIYHLGRQSPALTA
jgi:hypothetical protein